MGFSRQEYWSGLPVTISADLPKPGIEPTSPAWQVDSLPLSHLGSHPFYFITGNASRLTLKTGTSRDNSRLLQQDSKGHSELPPTKLKSEGFGVRRASVKPALGLAGGYGFREILFSPGVKLDVG